MDRDSNSNGNEDDESDDSVDVERVSKKSKIPLRVIPVGPHMHAGHEC